MDGNMPTEPLPPAQQPQPQPGYGPESQYARQPAPAHYQPHADEPFYKRYGLAFAISTLVLGAFVILAFVGAGAFAVGSVISHGIGISHVIEGKLPQELVPPGQDEGQGQGQQGAVPAPNSGSQTVMIRGTITSISGNTWTIDTQRGASVTVQVDTSTEFGTQNQTESASDFAVGDGVIVLGTRSGDTVTAIRVLGLSSLKQPLPTTPGTPVTPGPGPSK